MGGPSGLLRYVTAQTAPCARHSCRTEPGASSDLPACRLLVSIWADWLFRRRVGQSSADIGIGRRHRSDAADGFTGIRAGRPDWDSDDVRPSEESRQTLSAREAQSLRGRGQRSAACLVEWVLGVGVREANSWLFASYVQPSEDTGVALDVRQQLAGLRQASYNGVTLLWPVHLSTEVTYVHPSARSGADQPCCR